MNKWAYYNENDFAAAHVIRALIRDGIVAPGEVDERSIKDVQPEDVRGFAQCHWFAGGALWSVAARLAGWPDERPLWTGSCPCQPFSQAGKRAGADDPRHLWPDFHRLISSCRPAVVMGEQVAGADGYGWFDGVRTDLAREDYAGRCVDIPACAIDAPHQRNRLYWIAVDDGQRARLEGQRGDVGDRHEPGRVASATAGPSSSSDGELLAHADSRGCSGRTEAPQWHEEERTSPERIDAGLLGNPTGERRREGRPEHELWCGQNAIANADVQLQSDAEDKRQGREFRELSTPQGSRVREVPREGHRRPEPRSASDNLRNGSWWADAEWIVSPIDGKARRTKPGLPFLVDGLPGRVGLWRIGGNAISPVLAAEVIGAYLDCERAA